MEALLIRDEKTGAEWRVWPDPDVIPAGSIHETGSYLFELSGAEHADTADLLIDDVRLEALRAPAPASARWRWPPGFQAGLVEAELRLSGRSPRRFEITTDPDLRKLTRDDFDAMVREILDDTFALFSLSSFRKGIARGNGARPPAIARLEFLRSRIEELEVVVAAIARSPRRILKARDRNVAHYQATHATGPEILRSFQSGPVLRETTNTTRLPAALKGFLPAQIRIRQRQSSLDLPEHRQMAACLRAWTAWLTVAADQLDRGSRDRGAEVDRDASAWARRCRRLARRISQLATSAPFVEAGDAPPRLTLSALYRNDPSYRRFYRLWQDMNLGIAAIFGDFLNLPLARTFELYELWCFLRLVRAATLEFGDEGVAVQDLFISDASGGLTLAAGAVTVSVGDSWQLCFQKQYREFWLEPDRRGSYSRTMTPDIVAARNAAADCGRGRMIVLDAKYRVADGLNDALTSIHTYRDALVQEAEAGDVKGIVSAAYLLTPDMPAVGSTYRSTAMPGRLFHPQYRAGFRFGAMTLKPGMAMSDLTSALRLIIADATSEELA